MCNSGSGTVASESGEVVRSLVGVFDPYASSLPRPQSTQSLGPRPVPAGEKTTPSTVYADDSLGIEQRRASFDLL